MKTQIQAIPTGNILGSGAEPSSSDGLTLEAPPPERPSATVPKRRVRVLWKWSLAITAVIVVYFGWRIGSGMISGETSANSAISNFHWLLNRGYFQDIIDDTDEGFRTGSTSEETVKFFSQLHNKLGAAGATSGCYMTVTATPDATFITVRCNTNFEKGEVIETFSWVKSGDKLKLHGYNVSSKVWL